MPLADLRQLEVASFDFDSLWQGRHIEQVDGVEIPMIGNLLQLVYLAAHGSYHAWFRLKWVADFAAVFCATSPEDRRVAAALAREMGVGPVFDHALSLAHRLFAIPSRPKKPTGWPMRHDGRRSTPSRLKHCIITMHRRSGSPRTGASPCVWCCTAIGCGEPGFLVTQIALDLNFPGGLETSRLGDRWLWLYPAIRGWRSARHHITHRLGWHSAT
ncbi:nucleotidyltransferase family protein [Tistrella bauzanensis]